MAAVDDEVSCVLIVNYFNKNKDFEDLRFYTLGTTYLRSVPDNVSGQLAINPLWLLNLINSNLCISLLIANSRNRSLRADCLKSFG